MVFYAYGVAVTLLLVAVQSVLVAPLLTGIPIRTLVAIVMDCVLTPIHDVPLVE
jgi:hypothetical protein